MSNKKIDTICFDLSNSIAYKKKKSLIDLAALTGAKVSFVLNKSVNLLLKDDANDLDTYKCRTAFKLGIPVVKVDFLYHLTGLSDTNVSYNDFIIKNKQDEANFKKGLVSTFKKRMINDYYLYLF